MPRRIRLHPYLTDHANSYNTNLDQALTQQIGQTLLLALASDTTRRAGLGLHHRRLSVRVTSHPNWRDPLF
jgi:hypothetical protein